MSRLYSDNCDYCKHCYDHENWSCDIEEPCEEREDEGMINAFEKIMDRLEELHERYINHYGVVGGNPYAFSVKECMGIVREVAEEFATDTNVGTKWIPCKKALEMSAQALAKQLKAGGENISSNEWIPISERLPNPETYVLLSFENFSISVIGRYEQDKDGGAFYAGDEDETLTSQDMYVNAWMPLPEPYKSGSEGKE